MRDAVSEYVTRLFEAIVTQVAELAGAEVPDQWAAFLLVNDLAVLILRDRIREVLGVGPLSAAGMRRWGREVTAVYRDGIRPGA